MFMFILFRSAQKNVWSGSTVFSSVKVVASMDSVIKKLDWLFYVFITRDYFINYIVTLFYENFNLLLLFKKKKQVVICSSVCICCLLSEGSFK